MLQPERATADLMAPVIPGLKQCWASYLWPLVSRRFSEQPADSIKGAPPSQPATRKVYVPAIAMFSIKIEPVVLLPRVMVSAPTATI